MRKNIQRTKEIRKNRKRSLCMGYGQRVVMKNNYIND